MNETVALAEYASSVRYSDLPPEVLRRAKDCLIDSVAAIIYGQKSSVGQIVVAEVLANARGGRSRILGCAGGPFPAESAARANGTLAHAFELDSLRMPSAGVHPGAILIPAALAAAQERGAGGKALLTAIVAGCEVLFRIGKATRYTVEKRGFHAPGITGPFGAAAAAAHLFSLDAAATRNAFGIAGSLCGGLLEFAASRDGGMVKRLHLGRAAENGIFAARLAEAGFTGPSSVLEGRFGFLNAYCLETDPSALTAGLGQVYETPTLCLKQYACHITAQTPVRAVRTLKAEHGFSPDDVAAVVIEGNEKMAKLHADTAPADLVMAQYSIPFCVAVALLRDPIDPDSFTGGLQDRRVLDLCRRVEVLDSGAGGPNYASNTCIRLKHGQTYACQLSDFPGMPSHPLTVAALREKFLALTRCLGAQAVLLHDRLERIEEEETLDWLTGALP